MSTAPVSIRSLKTATEPPAAPSIKSDEPPAPQSRRGRQPRTIGLSLLEGGSALAVFVVWLVLFAAGILVDTRPYREVISPSAVAAMDAEASPPPPGAAATPAPTPAPRADAAVPIGWKTLMTAWFVTLVAYLPLNLAWLCATASALGTFGSRANLSDDAERNESSDNTSPYVSALLRGFFVYLFMTSGLLLLDETPFSSPSPGQYISLDSLEGRDDERREQARLIADDEAEERQKAGEPGSFAGFPASVVCCITSSSFFLVSSRADDHRGVRPRRVIAVNRPPA